MTLQLIGKEVPVEHHEINVYGIENQFNRHQHGDQVSPDDKAADPDEKHPGTEDKKMGDWNSLYHDF